MVGSIALPDGPKSVSTILRRGPIRTFLVSSVESDSMVGSIALPDGPKSVSTILRRGPNRTLLVSSVESTFKMQNNEPSLEKGG
jgi:hypothetical protein